jgi:hypothetical protein
VFAWKDNVYAPIVLKSAIKLSLEAIHLALRLGKHSDQVVVLANQLEVLPLEVLGLGHSTLKLSLLTLEEL